MDHRLPFLPIDRRNGLYLFPMDGDGNRFVAAFRRVWRAMPLAARRRLLKHWRENRPQWLPEGYPWPQIELIADKSNFSRGNSAEKATAQIGDFGCTFAFDAAFCDAAPNDCVIKSLVAHELAHSVLTAQGGEDYQRSCGTPETYESAPGEVAADEVAETWGFYQPRLHKKK